MGHSGRKSPLPSLPRKRERESTAVLAAVTSRPWRAWGPASAAGLAAGFAGAGFLAVLARAVDVGFFGFESGRRRSVGVDAAVSHQPRRRRLRPCPSPSSASPSRLFGFRLRPLARRALAAAGAFGARGDQAERLLERDRLRRLVARQRRVDAVMGDVRPVAAFLHQDRAALVGVVAERAAGIAAEAARADPWRSSPRSASPRG